MVADGQSQNRHQAIYSNLVRWIKIRNGHTGSCQTSNRNGVCLWSGLKKIGRVITKMICTSHERCWVVGIWEFPDIPHSLLFLKYDKFPGFIIYYPLMTTWGVTLADHIYVASRRGGWGVVRVLIYESYTSSALFYFKCIYTTILYAVQIQPIAVLLNRLFRRRSKKTPKLRVTGLCVGNSPGPVNSPHKWPVTRKMFPFPDSAYRWLSARLQ